MDENTGSLCQSGALKEAISPEYEGIPRAIIDFDTPDKQGDPHTVLGIGENFDDMVIIDNSFEGIRKGIDGDEIPIAKYREMNNFASGPRTRPIDVIDRDLALWQDPNFDVGDPYPPR